MISWYSNEELNYSGLYLNGDKLATEYKDEIILRLECCNKVFADYIFIFLQ